MLEFFHAAVSPVNLPLTILLLIVVLYWLIVIVGAMDIDFLDADWMPDLDAGDLDGVGYSILHFLNIGQIPVTLVISMLVLFAWTFSMLTNFYLNTAHSFLIAGALLVPNLFFTFIAVGFVMRPVTKIFGKMGDEDKEDQKVLYRVGTVSTSRVDAKFGQVEITTRGAPILINARTTGDLVLTKGAEALIYDEDKDKGVYFVEKHNA